jgi:hypothetical protein
MWVAVASCCDVEVAVGDVGCCGWLWQAALVWGRQWVMLGDVGGCGELL